MLILSAALLLSACTSATKGTPPPDSDLAFPPGKYQHGVQIETFTPKRNFTLNGAVESRADRIHVVGLSTFGTTVFQIEENLQTGSVKKEIYVDALKEREEKLDAFYGLLKELLSTKKHETSFERQGSTFNLSEHDEQGIARKVEILHPEVHLKIDVTGYEF